MHDFLQTHLIILIRQEKGLTAKEKVGFPPSTLRARIANLWQAEQDLPQIFSHDASLLSLVCEAHGQIMNVDARK